MSSDLPEILSALEFEPREKRVTGHFRFSVPEWTGHVLKERYAHNAIMQTVLERLADAIVQDVLASAAVQARIAQIRTELPVRIEQAVAAAITAAVLQPLTPTKDTSDDPAC